MLEGRKILITNVTHFAGVAATRHMVDQGATVLCHDESFTDEEARQTFSGETGAVALSAQEPAAIVEEAIAAAGHVDVLINNDAFPAIRAKIEDADAKDMREGLEAMVTRPFIMSGAIVPHFKQRQAGKIIFLTSATAFIGLPNYSMYVAARAATNGLAISLAKELARDNIQVNAIAPNFVENPDYFPPELLADEAAYAKITKNIPLGRLGKPHEISAVIAFYASDQSDFITGNVLPFAGGWA
ncbi:MAG: SDR family oxidoreductase [Alphaproteobacteria bacterium]